MYVIVLSEGVCFVGVFCGREGRVVELKEAREVVEGDVSIAYSAAHGIKPGMGMRLSPELIQVVVLNATLIFSVDPEAERSFREYPASKRAE